VLIVADSGSTKCDWILSNRDKETETVTMGFNPFFHSKEFVAAKLEENHLLKRYALEAENVFFYGAGCSNPKRNEEIVSALKQIFTHASIYVGHDLEGAALAVTPQKEGIACILGTGSNSTYWDGKKSIEHVPALGYVMGDEASGTYFGKILLRDFLYARLPQEIEQYLEEVFSLTKESIFDNVYSKLHPNVYLASFMKIFGLFRDYPYVQNVLREGFEEFCKFHIMCYENHKEIPVHFIGSVAYYFQVELAQVLKSYGIALGQVVQKPVYNLFSHLNSSVKAHN